MASFRRDPFGRAWVLMSPDRGLQPSDFGSVPEVGAPSPLVPGREAELPGEIQALRPSASSANAPDWRARVLPMPGSPFEARRARPGREGLYASVAASGRHELIVEHPDPAMSIDAMPRDHLAAVLRLYRDRVAFLSERPEVRHVQVTRAVGRAAGALYDHPHAQALALPVPNRWVEEEVSSGAAHHAATGRCVFCDAVTFELEQRERLVTSTADFVAITPWASKTPFETWILPREHQSGFASLASNLAPALGDALQTVLRALNHALDHPPYNLILHTLPRRDDPSYHWHIEVLPRLTRQGGYEWAGGYFVNPTPPEDATRFLRQALALSEVGT